MPVSWKDRSVCVTGGGGFLGRSVVRKLEERGCGNVFVPLRSGYDLTREGDIRRCLSEGKPDLLIHLAAVVGGIGANRASPGAFFFENAIMGLQLLEQARLSGIPKTVLVGTTCAYPKFTPVPFREEDLWMGYPEETNAPYGLAKKMLLVQSQAYRQQYGYDSIFLLPANLYGPGDDFDPETSHVIPALIRKCCEAAREGCPWIECWGTGEASREFLYVEDAAEGILLAAERYDRPEPVNLGTGREIRIRELAGLIAELCGFEGEIRWDPSRPDGQPRRCLDTSRAREGFGFEAKVPLEEGLRRTLQGFREGAHAGGEGEGPRATKSGIPNSSLGLPGY